MKREKYKIGAMWLVYNVSVKPKKVSELPYLLLVFGEKFHFCSKSSLLGKSTSKGAVCVCVCNCLWKSEREKRERLVEHELLLFHVL